MRSLSFGGGVNSVALLLELLRRGIWDSSWRAVMVDTGAEHPATMPYIQKHILPLVDISIIRADINGLGGLYDYCWHYSIVPSPRWRWCTEKAKVIPIISEYRRVRVSNDYIGFAAGEEHRALRAKPKPWSVSYPLIEWGYTRQDCERIISDAGLPPPPRSGCFFCPFKSASAFRRLHDEFPETFDRVLELERRCVDRRKREGKPPYYINERPLEQFAAIFQLAFQLDDKDVLTPDRNVSMKAG